MRFRFRFTVRRLMVAVAVAACLTLAGMWGREMLQLSREYQMTADRRESIRALSERISKHAISPAKRRAYKKMAEWYAQSRDEHARAAWRPWVTPSDEKPPNLKELMKAE